jgi:anti-anti-sigma factor
MALDRWLRECGSCGWTDPALYESRAMAEAQTRATNVDSAVVEYEIENSPCPSCGCALPFTAVAVGAPWPWVLDLDATAEDPTGTGRAARTSDIEVIDGAGDRWVVALHGEHDIATADRFAARLGEIFATGTNVVIDLSQAQFLDSTILHVILQVHRSVEDTPGKAIVLAVAPGNLVVQRLLEVSGLGRVLPVFTSRQHALEALTSS